MQQENARKEQLLPITINSVFVFYDVPVPFLL